MNKNEYEVVGNAPDHVEIAVGGWREIAQCIKMIITTWRGTVFNMREFGINPAIIDQPENMILANLTIDITNQISKYEPRAEITGISFDRSNLLDGEIVPTITFRVKEDVLL